MERSFGEPTDDSDDRGKRLAEEIAYGLPSSFLAREPRRFATNRNNGAGS